MPRLFRKKKLGIPCPGSKIMLEKHGIPCQILCGPRTPSVTATIISKGASTYQIVPLLPNSSGWRAASMRGAVNGHQRCKLPRGRARAQSCTRPASFSVRVFCNKLSFGAEFPQGVVVLFLEMMKETELSMTCFSESMSSLREIF